VRRGSCEARSDGWFNGGALAKIRCIVRDKIGLLSRGIAPEVRDYERVVGWPNLLLGEEAWRVIVPEKGGAGWSLKEVRLSAQFRALAGKVEGSTPVRRGKGKGKERETGVVGMEAIEVDGDVELDENGGGGDGDDDEDEMEVDGDDGEGGVGMEVDEDEDAGADDVGDDFENETGETPAAG